MGSNSSGMPGRETVSSGRTVRAVVNPEILKWARKRVNISIDKAAGVIGVTPSRLTECETDRGDGIGKNTLTFKQLKKYAEYLKLNIVTFYLPKVPKEHRKFTYFRNLAEALVDPYTREVDRTLRELIDLHTSICEIWKELDLSFNFDFISSINPDTDIDIITETIVKRLGVDCNSFRGDTRSKYNTWREIAERHGIITVHFSLPPQFFGGLTFKGDVPPLIAVNSRLPVKARLFSLVHEICHIFLKDNEEEKEGHMCKIIDGLELEVVPRLEALCNKAAARILVPGDRLRRVISESGGSEFYNLPLDKIKPKLDRIGSEFGVSKYVIAIRAKEPGLIGRYIVDNLMEEYKERKKAD